MKLAALVKHMAEGRASPPPDTRTFLHDVYKERCHAAEHHWSGFQVRVNLQDKDDAASYAGWITQPNPTSGPYAGTSLVWFPAARGSVLVLVTGTEGFGSDAHILGRPGHARRLRALARLHDALWVKPDPLDLTSDVPAVVSARWPDIGPALRAYGRMIYAAAPIGGASGDLQIVKDLFDLFFTEHGVPLKDPARREWAGRHERIMEHVFPTVPERDLEALVRERRFVILEGPPGTGKTRLALNLARRISTAPTIVQFHPARTYEDFVVGLAPVPLPNGLAFEVRRGDLLRANERARERGEHALVIDEINRGDLARVLGEALFLFESGEPDRTITLPHRPEGYGDAFGLAPGLVVIGTRNTADRTIARMDLAIRRRFAFVHVWPDLAVLPQDEDVAFARELFEDTLATFTEFADDEVLRLVPGHAYFLDPRPDAPVAGRAARVRSRITNELVPLLRDYLDERLCGGASEAIAGLHDRIAARARNAA